MSSITNEQYVTLSNLANYNFHNLPAFGVTLSNVTFSPDFPLTTPEMTAFDTLSGWKVMYADHNADTGFQAVAFEGPDDQVVISFRGTTVNADNWADFFNDARIAFNNETFGEPNQFQDTAKFITDVVSMLTGTPASELTPELVEAYFTSRNSDNDPSNQITFTGHSLGGGLCQYASYLTGGSAVTFNAVGVGQFVPAEDHADFISKITDYVNAFDIIGNFGTQLGTQVVLQDIDFMQLTDASKNLVVKILQLEALSTFGVIGSVKLPFFRTLSSDVSGACLVS